MMRAIPGLVAMAALLSACGAQSPDPQVTGAWVRLPAVQGRPAAGYFTIRGGSTPTNLLAVSAPFALKAELHETAPDLSVTVAPGQDPPMTMRAIRDVPVPAGGTVSFEPGGKHVMLYDLGPAAKPGTSAPIALEFANGKRIEVEAKLVAAGDPPPAR